MADQRNRKQKRRNRYQNNVQMLLVTIIVLCFGFVMMYQMNDMRAQDNRYEMQEASLQKQLDDETQRKEDLKESQSYVQTRQYIEQIAREKLGLVNPNETIVKSKD